MFRKTGVEMVPTMRVGETSSSCLSVMLTWTSRTLLRELVLPPAEFLATV